MEENINMEVDVLLVLEGCRKITWKLRYCGRKDFLTIQNPDLTPLDFFLCDFIKNNVMVIARTTSVYMKEMIPEM